MKSKRETEILLKVPWDTAVSQLKEFYNLKDIKFMKFDDFEGEHEVTWTLPHYLRGRVNNAI